MSRTAAAESAPIHCFGLQRFASSDHLTAVGKLTSLSGAGRPRGRGRSKLWSDTPSDAIRATPAQPAGAQSVELLRAGIQCSAIPTALGNARHWCLYGQGV